jgi:phosphatidylinositol 3-kinase
MDKENKEDFSFGRSCDLKVPVTFRMSVWFNKVVSLVLTQSQFSARGRASPSTFHRAYRKARTALPRGSISVRPAAAIPPIAADGLFSTLSDLYVTCQLLADNKPLTIPFRTSYKAFKNTYTSVSCGTRLVCVGVFMDCLVRWNEWITLPIRYCDLPLSSQITFTVWDVAGPRAAVPAGGTTFRLFSKKWCVVTLGFVLLHLTLIHDSRCWKDIEEGKTPNVIMAQQGSRWEFGNRDAEQIGD